MNWKKVFIFLWLPFVLPPIPMTVSLLAHWSHKGHTAEVLRWSTLTDDTLWSAVLEMYCPFLHPSVFPFWTGFFAFLLLLSCVYWLLRPGRFSFFCTVFCGWVLCGLPAAVAILSAAGWRYHSDMERLLELQQRFPQ